MSLLTVGYWQDTFWPENYWDPDYWLQKGDIVSGVERITGDSLITQSLSGDSLINESLTGDSLIHLVEDI